MIKTCIMHSGECPCWKIPIGVRGWYRETQVGGEWTFICAECPIIENAKRPLHEQEPEYKLMRCPDEDACPLYTQFQPTITSPI